MDMIATTFDIAISFSRGGRCAQRIVDFPVGKASTSMRDHFQPIGQTPKLARPP
jgi:hypothetical protein